MRFRAQAPATSPSKGVDPTVGALLHAGAHDLCIKHGYLKPGEIPGTHVDKGLSGERLPLRESGDLPTQIFPGLRHPDAAVLLVIELVGLTIKHGVLAVRLLANMVAGHLVLLGVMGLAFGAEAASLAQQRTLNAVHAQLPLAA